ncbi:hypothetical protein JVX91_22125 [Pseudomonas sp. PDNC002]|uniref:hypothetical protein n=1 Tax=Pseudomonas sp. PDNC002 TaxID=2811422 RepID=UPI001966BA12|nr:hypothetical protein [Pseudomonas sp. PDNC002]QRY78261.1 hypothetical protein JVX91_22125 [Pseudomonas sp. PDNC002]
MDTRTKSRRANHMQIWTMGAGLIFLSLLLAWLLVSLWPQHYPAFPPAGHEGDPEVQCLLGWCPGPDARLLVMVMVAGGLGSFVHIAKSFGDFVGNDRFMASWIWWYILKPFIGMILAVMLYLIIRGGFLTVGSGTAQADGAVNVNLYGLIGMACLAGMFAKQATDKLGELFDTLFRTTGGDKRRDALGNPVPSLTDAQPGAVDVQSLYVSLQGTGFVRGAVVQVNGVSRETTVSDSTRLAVQLLEEDLEPGRPLSLVVVNPPPGGGESAPLMLPLLEAPTVTDGPMTGLSARTAVESPVDVDGCDCPIEHETADEDLPAASGGVQA